MRTTVSLRCITPVRSHVWFQIHTPATKCGTENTSVKYLRFRYNAVKLCKVKTFTDKEQKKSTSCVPVIETDTKLT